MSVRLFIAERLMPAFVAKCQFEHLFEFTALAFERRAPSLEGLSVDDCVQAFAAFSRSCVDQAAVRGEDLAVIQERLFREALTYGAVWRRILGVRSRSEIMRAARMLYGVLRIDFHGSEDGSIEIRECFFSRYYTPSTCRIISSLDRGILAGLSGGGELRFSERLTEGSIRCSAHLGLGMDGA